MTGTMRPCRWCGHNCYGHPTGKPRQRDGLCGDCRKVRTPPDERAQLESPDTLDESAWERDGLIQRHPSARSRM